MYLNTYQYYFFNNTFLLFRKTTSKNIIFKNIFKLTLMIYIFRAKSKNKIKHNIV